MGTGRQGFIGGLVGHVLLLILFHVLFTELSILFISCLAAIKKTML